MGGMYWIDLVQHGDRWRALLKAVMNRWVAVNAGNLTT